MQKTMSDEAECAKGICKPQSTAMFDNAECQVSILQILESEAAAISLLQQLTDKAQSIQSEPCHIEHSITSVAQGWQLNAEFTFCCQAEAVIFQMALRRFLKS